ncbi:MAG: hypothetical protein WC773_04685 [Patescibacteria group bacterium]|jgi:hypothetical protein
MSDTETKVEQGTTNEPGLMLTISKQTAMTGEVISVATNLPKGWTREQLSGLINDVTWAIDKRMSSVNEKVLELTNKHLEDLYLTKVEGEA